MRTLLLGALVLPLALLAACDSTAPDARDAALSAEARSSPSLATARSATARYRHVDRAVAAGWVSPPGNPCVEAPPGGMGYHYVNFGLLDGTLDPAHPEALLYAPTKNGRLRLVAVEYIVPFEALSEAGPAPTLFGQTFHPSQAAGGWALHAWIWARNPAGMFADFNPRVSCHHT